MPNPFLSIKRIKYKLNKRQDKINTENSREHSNTRPNTFGDELFSDRQRFTETFFQHNIQRIQEDSEKNNPTNDINEMK
ncbi:hypothetical protein A6J40_03185 [Legionella longbeachae]|nr:hypothetical protein A6J40_03185 [Legionella longbeachae]EEZ94880.1 hypothetical protein LLB_0030 [Legionella longbeachae D-4968]VEE02474.1 Uncharacterised protein [Legionella oakridgensis]